jgi:hypothetical protein
MDERPAFPATALKRLAHVLLGVIAVLAFVLPEVPGELKIGLASITALALVWIFGFYHGRRHQWATGSLGRSAHTRFGRRRPGRAIGG